MLKILKRRMLLAPNLKQGLLGGEAVRTISRISGFVCVALLLACGTLFLLASASDRKAQQNALNNSADTFAESLGVDLARESAAGDVEGGSSQRSLGIAALALAALAGGVSVWGARGARQKSRSSMGQLIPKTAVSSSRGAAVATLDVPRRGCPQCGELVAKSARVCRFCRIALQPDG